MKLQNFHELGEAFSSRQAFQAYGEQERRFERIRPSTETSSADSSATTSSTPAEKEKNSGFSLRLGKLNVNYEVEEPPFDTEQLAGLALERVQREREAAFRVEMEVAELRNAISKPAMEEDDATLLALSSEETAPSHVKAAAQRAYAEQQRAPQMSALRPGVHIGVA